MQRREQTVADSSGLGRVEKLSKAEREFVSDEATRLCELRDDSPGLRERGPGTNPVLRAVADRFAIAREIHTAEGREIPAIAEQLRTAA